MIAHLLLAVVTPQPSPDLITIHGIGLGDSCDSVLARFGIPGPDDSKRGDLHSDRFASVMWRGKGFSVDFSYGRVQQVSAFQEFKDTSVLGFKSSLRDLKEKYGDPFEIDTTTIPNTTFYEFTNGLEYAYKNDKVSWIMLSQRVKDNYIEDQEAKSKPNYKLVLVESSGYSRTRKGEKSQVIMTTIKGIVRNDRDEDTDITIRGIWRAKYKDGTKTDFLNASETKLYGVKAGESKVFEVSGDSFVVPSGASEIVYDVELSGS